MSHNEGTWGLLVVVAAAAQADLDLVFPIPYYCCCYYFHRWNPSRPCDHPPDDENIYRVRKINKNIQSKGDPV